MACGFADCRLCGSSNNYEKSGSIRFAEKLKKYIANRGIEQMKISYLSDFFTPTHHDYNRIQEIFRDIISDLTLDDFLNIVTKDILIVLRMIF